MFYKIIILFQQCLAHAANIQSGSVSASFTGTAYRVFNVTQLRIDTNNVKKRNRMDIIFGFYRIGKTVVSFKVVLTKTIYIYIY